MSYCGSKFVRENTSQKYALLNERKSSSHPEPPLKYKCRDKRRRILDLGSLERWQVYASVDLTLGRKVTGINRGGKLVDRYSSVCNIALRNYPACAGNLIATVQSASRQWTVCLSVSDRHLFKIQTSKANSQKNPSGKVHSEKLTATEMATKCPALRKGQYRHCKLFFTNTFLYISFVLSACYVFSLFLVYWLRHSLELRQKYNYRGNSFLYVGTICVRACVCVCVCTDGVK